MENEKDIEKLQNENNYLMFMIGQALGVLNRTLYFIDACAKNNLDIQQTKEFESICNQCRDIKEKIFDIVYKPEPPK
jgi:hypothetical protein